MDSPIQSIDFACFTDFDGVLSETTLTPEQLKTARLIDESLRSNGFMLLSNLGLTRQQLDKYYALGSSIFDLPDEYKTSSLKAIDQKTNQGYITFNREALNRKRSPDLKEAFNICNRGEHPANFRGCPSGFEAEAREMWDHLEGIARRLAVAFAIALDFPCDFFLSRMEKFESAVIRFIHYPPCEFNTRSSSGEDPHSSIRVGEHTDFGMFTLLFNDEPGLQVKKKNRGEIDGAPDEWMDVPVPSGASAIVNTGGLLARWTNDVWQATPHRVIVPNEDIASMDRYAIACFWDPDRDALVEVDPKFVASGGKPKYEPITGSEYIDMKLDEAFGYSAL